MLILWGLLFNLVIGDLISYKAGVLEYTPIPAPPLPVNRTVARNLMLSNIANYESYISTSASQGVEILVFPEYGINGPIFLRRTDVESFAEEIPDPDKVTVNPCKEWRHDSRVITFRLSCLARKYQMILVVNMADKVRISDTEWHQYNTQVAFNSDGTLLQKYHKENLYYEPWFDTPVGQKPKYFTNAKGIKFGMGICFDILFLHPMTELVRQGVKDFVYSTWWVNTPPVLNGVSMQKGWSQTNHINLLASGAGRDWRCSGSGIYQRGLTLKSYFNPTMKSGEKLLVSTVRTTACSKPKIETQPISTHYPQGYNISVTKVRSPGVYSTDLPNISCTFFFSRFENPENQTYALIAIHGFYWPLFSMSSCGVYVCPDENNCGVLEQTLLPGSGLFDDAQLKVTFLNPNLTVYPIATRGDGSLFTKYHFRSAGQHFHINSREGFQLQSFSLLGRDYTSNK